jgi:hypothetical protein
MTRVTITFGDKEAYSLKMGNNLSEVYLALYQEVISVRWVWNEYMQLFGNEERVKILNTAAGKFFNMIQGIMSDDVVLAISRLTDNTSSRGKPNLTVKALDALVSEQHKAELLLLVNSAVDAAAFTREWRNRHYAHRDLAISLLDDGISTLPNRTTDNIEKAISALQDVVRFLAQKYLDTHIVFDASGFSGAVSLLHVLRDGNQKRQDLLDKHKRGNLDLSDLPTPI